MRIPGAWRIRKAVRKVSSRLSRGTLVLLYHRVADLPTDPQLLAVTPQHFAEHMEIVRGRFRPLRLEALRNLALGAGRLPRRSVVVTFDDGYADNLHAAKPVLERAKVPATIFISTGLVGHEGEFWIDKLTRLLLHPGRLPSPLRVTVNGQNHQWDLGATATYSAEDFQNHRGWNLRAPNDPTARQSTYRAMSALLQPLPNAERQRLLDELLANATATTPDTATPQRALSPDEITALAAGGFVEIGAHTISHPVLSALPVADQRAEIAGSKAALEKILGRPITSFAYPYGRHIDYTLETVALVRESGYTCAASNFPGLVRWGTDALQLPRMLVRDCDGATFARQCDDWFCE